MAPARPGSRPPRTQSQFDDWIEGVLERADPFMAWLGVVFALLVGFEIAADPRGLSSEILVIAGWVIWAIFALEFLVALWLAPDRTRYLKRHWWQPPMIIIPTLRIFRFVRLLRLGRALPAGRVLTSSYRAAGTARNLLRSRTGYLAALGAVATVAVAELAYLFERDAPDGVFGGFGDALLWSLSTVLGMQSDPVPATVGGRLAMTLGFAVGLVVIAALAGTVGAYLVDERRERAETEEPTAPRTH